MRASIFVLLAASLAACTTGAGEDARDGAIDTGDLDAPSHDLDARSDAIFDADDAAPSDAGPPVSVSDGVDAIDASNGPITLHYDKRSGRVDIDFVGVAHVHGAYASVDLGKTAGGYVKSVDFPSHVVPHDGVTEVHDAFGDGTRIEVDDDDGTHPTIRQIFTLYRGAPFLLVNEDVVGLGGATVSSNWLGALIVDGAGTVETEPNAPDARVLDVPYDNDEWARYDARALGAADFDGTGYEVGVVYESSSRHGLVVGSITHDTWKTGFYYSATKGRLRAMNVYGGASSADVVPTPAGGPTYGDDGTHDSVPHGAISGAKISAPTIYLGGFSDWRAGLEDFGRANAVIRPMKPWSGGVPVGWSSWAPFGTGFDTSAVIDAGKGLKTLTGDGFAGEGGVVYVNVDAGLSGDIHTIIDTIHALGMRVGVYRVPFMYGGDLNAMVWNGLGKTYSEVVLRNPAPPHDPVKWKGQYVLDPSHPSVQSLLRHLFGDVNALGADFVKLDFLTHGALEGLHADATVKTGVQAYDLGMKTITETLNPNVFVDLSIAPLFPHGWGHARRVSCDVMGELNDEMWPTYPYKGSTEFMLEATTFGWWESGTLYRFDDPDSMALLSFTPHGSESGFPTIPETWAQTRFLASVIAGTVLIDGTDLGSSAGLDRAKAVYGGKPAVMDVARAGIAFRPLDGDVGYVAAKAPTGTYSGSKAAHTFVREEDGGSVLIATFDFGASSTTRTIDLARAGVPAGKHVIHDLVTNVDIGGATTEMTWSVTLEGGGSRLVRVSSVH